MKIATLNGATAALTNKEIESSVYKLGFTFEGVVATLATPEATPDPASILTTLIGDTEITISKQDGQNTSVLINRMKLKDVAEISTHNEGVIFISRAYSATAGDNLATIEFCLEVSNDAAFKLDDQAKLILNIEGKPANMTLDVETIDHPNVGNQYIAYDSKFVNLGASKDFAVEQHYAVAVPIADTTSIELHYNNGKSVILTASEVKKTLRDSQDEIFIINNKTIYGCYTWAVLSIEQCYKITVLMSASKNIYLIKNQAA